MKLRSGLVDAVPALLLIVASAWAASARAQSLLDKTLTVELAEGISLELVRIESGTFQMGQEDGEDDEKLIREVNLAVPFYMGKTEVTQQQWQALMSDNPSRFKNPQHPVENVSWYDCQAFLRKLADKAADQGNWLRFRLPTEAEWEYACRAGKDTAFDFGSNAADLDQFGWHDGNAQGSTHPVGQKKANAWGLHDMHGNVWEWCSDYYQKDHAIDSPPDDPKGPKSGTTRVRRGGSWYYPAYYHRSAYRNFHEPAYRNSQTGFRVACRP